MELDNNLEKKIVEWLDNIVGVPTKDIGLLLGDSVKKWRVKNQLNTLAKAIEKAKQLKLPLKVISPKLLCPLLENCSLEDDDFMQDKWANMLTNMLDSEQNIQNHVLPFILSQIGKSEFQQLEFDYLLTIHRVQLVDHYRKEIEKKYDTYVESIDKMEDYITDLFKIEEGSKKVTVNRYNLTAINLNSLDECGKANLLRLGLITAVPIIKKENTLFSKIDLQRNEYFITGLGELFMKTCLPNESFKDLLMSCCRRLRDEAEVMRE